GASPSALVPATATARKGSPLPKPVLNATRGFRERERLHVQIIDLARPEDRAWLVPGRTPALECGGVVALAHPDRAPDAAESVKTLRRELERDSARTVVLLEDARPVMAPEEPIEPEEDLSARAVRVVCQDHELRWNECLPEEKWLLYHVAGT